jgi:uncharacterized protein DUF397
MLSNTWKKSSRSNGNGGNNCVEVRMTSDEILVRDSKDEGTGPVLKFTRMEWLAFVGGAKDSEFDI